MKISKRLAASLTGFIVASSLAACSSPHRHVGKSVLVVGDSIADQAATAFKVFAPPGMTVSVAAAPGSAPCDWKAGFAYPASRRRSLTAALNMAKPQVVIFLFSGNPGLSGPRAGCVDTRRPYRLATLLTGYISALSALVRQASARGAAVYLERPPPRNPALPQGPGPGDEDWGYQGAPAIAQVLQAMARESPVGSKWAYVTGGAEAVSGQHFTYEANLPCGVLDERRCVDGRVRVRAGGSDAVHLDQTGCGALLFAIGVLAQLAPLGNGGSYGAFVERRRDHYPGCR
jgi:hypothetical protein